MKSSTWNKLVPLFISFNENSGNRLGPGLMATPQCHQGPVFLPLLKKQNKTNKQKTSLVSDTIPLTRDSCFLSIIILEIHKEGGVRKKQICEPSKVLFKYLPQNSCPVTITYFPLTQTGLLGYSAATKKPGNTVPRQACCLPVCKYILSF